MAKKKGKNTSVSKTAKVPTTSSEGAAYSNIHSEVPNSNIITTSVTTSPILPPIMLKLCRLCESKDGPFLNIFGAETLLAKKIDELLPVVIDEYDELPHKICFRCSAKVEELHEFAQKCVKTQENLHKLMNKKDNIPKSNLARKTWEEKLNKSKMSNEDYCDALIKKAMESIKDIPLPPPLPEDNREITLKPTLKATEPPKKLTRTQQKNLEELEQLETDDVKNLLLPIKQVKVVLDRVKKNRFDDKPISTRLTRSTQIEPLLGPLENFGSPKKFEKSEATDKSSTINKDLFNSKDIIGPGPNKNQEQIQESQCKNKNDDCVIAIKDKPIDLDSINANEASQESVTSKDNSDFDIMQHVSSIKVNGVGFLFQCKICNRNFLKKEVVLTHGCTRARMVKLNASKVAINNAQNNAQSCLYTKDTTTTMKPNLRVPEELHSKKEASYPTKPRPGPASKTRTPSSLNPAMATIPLANQLPPPIPPNLAHPSVEVGGNFPGNKVRYKLIPGPNNTFTLVEDTSATVELSTSDSQKKSLETPQKSAEVPSLKRKSNKQDNSPAFSIVKKRTKAKDKRKADVVIDLDDTPDEICKSEPSVSMPPVPITATTISTPPVTSPPVSAYQSSSEPYPVGLFQNIPPPKVVPVCQPNVTFTTPAMKKQSYTIVQTGNPSKLLISTKSSAAANADIVPPVQIPEPTKTKKGRKSKVRQSDDVIEPEVQKQPFSVTIEDSARAKDPNEGFFTFINVDPLLQPSYVLPTSNIIQESQISTSTPNDNAAASSSDKEENDLYTCEICSMPFTREKKLLSHLQSHYAKAEEDWNPTKAKKRSRRS